MSEALSTGGLPDWPLFGLADDMRPAMAQAQAAGEPFALATLIAAEGGAPRPLGAQMLIGAERLSGFLSGGCVEGDVAGHARATLADGDPRRLVYGHGSPWPDIRLLCGARIEVLVQAVAHDDPAISALLAARDARRPAWLTTDGRSLAVVDEGPARDLTLEQPVRMMRRYLPVRRLAVVGGDPTALAIAALAAGMGFETTLLRPKGPEAGPPLAGVAYDRRGPDVALAALGLDRWTHVAVATHDLEVDEAALIVALPSAAATVGVLMRRRIPERRARLKAAGVSEQALARLKAPIGLDLGGKSPFEIAVAVMGEIVAHRSDPPDARA